MTKMTLLLFWSWT